MLFPYTTKLINSNAQVFVETANPNVFDVLSCCQEIIPPMDRKQVSLGFRVYLPGNKILLITNYNTLLSTNGIGTLTQTIKHTDKSEIFITLFNYTKIKYMVRKHQKIAEAILLSI